MATIKKMTIRKMILLGLLFPAVGMVIANIFLRDEGWEILCLVYAIPVFTLNVWEWFMPELMEVFFGKKKEE